MKKIIDEIVKFILDNNPYFGSGSFVFSSGVREVFPDDTRGNYFYVRLPDEIRISNDKAYSVAGCSVPAGIEARATLVACVKNADIFILAENLVNTMQAIGLRPSGLILDPEAVIHKEIKEAEDRKRALANVGDYSIISINFEFRYPVNPRELTCLPSPCSC